MDFTDLEKKMQTYLPPEKISLVESAYEFAMKAHEGQKEHDLPALHTWSTPCKPP